MRSFFKKPMNTVCLALFLLIVLSCFIGPSLSPYTGMEMDLENLYGLPSAKH